MRNTLLEDRELNEDEKNIVRSLYYEGRILLEDVADLLGPREAMRVYILNREIESDSISKPNTEYDDEFYDEIPDEIPDSVIDEVREE